MSGSDPRTRMDAPRGILATDMSAQPRVLICDDAPGFRLLTRTVLSDAGFEVVGAAARTASPVPSGSSCTASTTFSGRSDSSARSGPPTTTTLAAPASNAACTGHRPIGRPQMGCRTLGVAERMRVPWPAARTTAIGGIGRHGTSTV